MNTRTRQKVKATLSRKNRPVMFVIKTDSTWHRIVFVEQDKVREFMKEYSDDIIDIF